LYSDGESALRACAKRQYGERYFHPISFAGGITRLWQPLEQAVSAKRTQCPRNKRPSDGIDRANLRERAFEHVLERDSPMYRPKSTPSLLFLLASGW
jgi:hypothetical protein